MQFTQDFINYFDEIAPVAVISQLFARILSLKNNSFTIPDNGILIKILESNTAFLLITTDPKLVRPMLLAYKDYDEGRIDKERLNRCVEEFFQPANRGLSSQEFMEKYPIFNPLKKKRKKEAKD